MSRKLVDLTEDDLVAIIRAQFDMRVLAPLPGLPTPTKINSPMGQFDSQATSGFTSVPPGTAETKEYFLVTNPREYATIKSARVAFLQLFGMKGLAMLDAWGVVEGHKDAQFRPSAEQLEFFLEDGTRAFYTVAELQERFPEDRKRICQNFSDAVLLMLARENKDMKLWTTKTPGILAMVKPV